MSKTPGSVKNKKQPKTSKLLGVLLDNVGKFMTDGELSAQSGTKVKNIRPTVDDYKHEGYHILGYQEDNEYYYGLMSKYIGAVPYLDYVIKKKCADKFNLLLAEGNNTQVSPASVFNSVADEMLELKNSNTLRARDLENKYPNFSVKSIYALDRQKFIDKLENSPTIKNKTASTTFHLLWVDRLDLIDSTWNCLIRQDTIDGMKIVSRFIIKRLTRDEEGIITITDTTPEVKKWWQAQQQYDEGRRQIKTEQAKARKEKHKKRIENKVEGLTI